MTLVKKAAFEAIQMPLFLFKPVKPIHAVTKDMYTVYLLYSFDYDKIYIGYTSHLIERFKSHNHLGKKGWTIKYRPWVVAYTEVFEDKSEARRREKQLKSGAGRQYCWQQVEKIKSYFN